MSTIRDYKEEIQDYFNRGVTLGKKFMVIMCDTFDFEDYPSYHDTIDSANEYINEKADKNMARFMSLFDLTSGEKIKGF